MPNTYSKLSSKKETPVYARFYRHRMKGENFKEMFNKTLLPKFVSTAGFGEPIIMDYNLFMNRHKLNKDHIEIVDHCSCRSLDNFLTAWMFMIRDRNGKIIGVNGAKMKTIDPVRLIHYINKNKVGEDNEIFDWARSNNLYDIPIIHKEVSEMVELERRAGWIKNRLENNHFEMIVDIGNDSDEDNENGRYIDI